MPIYTYECNKCKHKFKLTQDYKADDVAHCKKCGHLTKRIFDSCNFILKGKDWPGKKYKEKK